MLKSILIAFSCILLCTSDNPDGPIVEISLGKLRGFTFELGDNKRADIFLNIPFAKPPIGELRFEKPQPPKPWTGIREAKTWGPICYPHVIVENFADPTQASEDCLQLNVFKPNLTTHDSKGYPVLVWIHGGGFEFAHASLFGYEYLSKNFISREIIVVSIQYRLGPLGWISTGDSVMPGNLGYWDMTQALKFIHENIGYFGGDPKRITVWGESAGAIAVSALTMSPHSRDYVAQSVEMSGSVFMPVSSNDDVVEASQEIIKTLSCEAQDPSQIKECLRAKTIDEISNAVLINGPARKGLNMIKFHPRNDGDFFPVDYPELIKTSPPKPAMIGFTDVESALHALVMVPPLVEPLITDVGIQKSQYPTYGQQNLTRFIKEEVAPEKVLGHFAKEVQEKLIEFYLKRGKPENADYKFYIERYVQLLSDAQFKVPAILTAQLKMKSNWPVYLYLNEHYNDKNYDQELPVKGCIHTCESIHFFGYNFTGPFIWDESEFIVQKIQVETMANFIKTGDPSMPSLKWPQLTQDHPLIYFSIKTEPKVKEPLEIKVWNFWKELMNKYPYDIIRRKPNEGYKNDHEEL